MGISWQLHDISTLEQLFGNNSRRDCQLTADTLLHKYVKADFRVRYTEQYRIASLFFASR